MGLRPDGLLLLPASASASRLSAMLGRSSSLGRTVVLFAALGLACSSTSRTQTKECTANESTPCFAPSGCVAQKVCSPTGDGYGACQCVDGGAGEVSGRRAAERPAGAGCPARVEALPPAAARAATERREAAARAAEPPAAARRQPAAGAVRAARVLAGAELAAAEVELREPAAGAVRAARVLAGAVPAAAEPAERLGQAARARTTRPRTRALNAFALRVRPRSTRVSTAQTCNRTSSAAECASAPRRTAALTRFVIAARRIRFA